MKKAAILLIGGISKKKGQYLQNYVNIIKDSKDSYVNFTSCFLSIQKCIVKANPDFNFDFFIHSWSFDLKSELDNLYKPIVSLYEDNSQYKDILNKKKRTGHLSTISRMLSMKKGIELIEKSQKDYSFIILIRPDILIWKNIELKLLDENILYVDGHHIPEKFKGDNIFIMNMKNLHQMKHIFDYEEIPYGHNFTYKFITQQMQKKPNHDFKMLDLVPPKDFEILRKIYHNSYIKYKTINENILKEFNLSLEEIKQYEI